MNKEDLRIIFLGTPEFAVESLKRLHEGGYNIVSVVTMPDKVGGRGNKVIQSAVKEYALANSLPLLQPEKLKDEGFINTLRELKADLQIVIAFRMLPEIVWSMPRLGTFNLHASLLPKYRGAAPINRAVMNGEQETGVTTFMLKHELDTGDILKQVKIPIDIYDDVETVHDKLMFLGADTVIETVDSIIAGNHTVVPQKSLIAQGIETCGAPKIFKEDCNIDWKRPAMEVYNHIRGLSPYPAAWTTLANSENSDSGIQLKIYKTSLPQKTSTEILPGSIVADKHHVFAVCGDGCMLELLSIQVSGKKRISGDEFLRGTQVAGKRFI